MFRRRNSLFPLPPVVALLMLAVWLQPSAVRAHGDLLERIQKLSAQITAQPADAALLLQRADLRRQHGEFKEALADLDSAAKLNSDHRVILLAQTRVFSDAGQTTDALKTADEFIALEPGSTEAFTLRARCRFKLNQATGAIEDYTAALAKTVSPEPDLYLERARAQAALGQISNAVKGLDEGVARLGEVPSLQLAAIEYDRQRGDFDSALVRLEKLTVRQPVKEPWLVLRGEIQAQAGRLVEAKATFQQALTGIGSYPGVRRGLDQTTQLQTRAREGLARVETKLARKSKT